MIATVGSVRVQLPQPPVSRTVVTVAGWLTYVPRLHNCHGEGYQLVSCDGSPGPEITSRTQDLTSLLGGYVEIDSLQSRVALAENSPSERDPLDVLLAACAQLPKDAALLEFIAFDRYSLAAGQPLANWNRRPRHLATHRPCPAPC